MSAFTDISFCELKAKDVVNACDGRKLGRIIDVVFCCETGEIRGIVTPCSKSFFFSRSQALFIPWNCVRKLGEDVIIVDIDGGGCEPGGRLHIRLKNNKGCSFDASTDIGRRDGCPPTCGDGCPPGEGRDRCGPSCDDGCRGKCDDGRREGCDCDGKCEKCMLFDCAYRWKKRR